MTDTQASPEIVGRMKQVLALELRRPEMTGEPFSLEALARAVITAYDSEAAATIERLREALERAPIIAKGEPSAAFRERQDVWLNGEYRAAMRPKRGE